MPGVAPANQVAKWLDLFTGPVLFPVLIVAGPIPNTARWGIQPVNTSGAGFAATMPSPVQLGTMVGLADTGFLCGSNALTLTDPNGYLIEDPSNMNGGGAGQLVSTLQFNISGATITWALLQDPVKGIFWKAIAPSTASGSGGGGGGGGWTVQALATSNVTLNRVLWQIVPVDSAGGTFSVTLPSAPTVGDRIDLQDVRGTTPATGINATNVTINPNGKKLQNPHTMAIGTGNLAWGALDGGGATLSLQYVNDSAGGGNGDFWKVIGS